MNIARNNRIGHASFVALSVLALSVGFIFASSQCFADAEVGRAPQLSEKQKVESSISLDVGIGGVYKSGDRTQVTVSFDDSVFNGELSRPASMELETSDSDGAPFVQRSQWSEGNLFKACVTLPKATGNITVRLIAEDGTVYTRVFEPKGKKSEDNEAKFALPASSTKPIYLTIGSSDLGFSEAFAEMRWKDERRPTIVEVKDANELPVDFRAYEAADKLFISTDKAVEFFKNVSDVQLRAIEDWVKNGGSLVMLAEEKSIPLLGEGGALAALSPGSKVEERAQEFRNVNAFTSELQNVKNLAMTGSKSKPYLRVPVLSELKKYSKVEMREVETPLLVVRPVGLGTVVFFAADLSVAPLNGWSGRGRLMLKLLGVDPDQAIAKASSSGFVKRGYSDLSGQARSALDVFDGVKTVSFSIIAGLIFVYLLCIAPFDWFGVKKLWKKPNATWITFPLFAVIFCAIGVGLFRASTPKAPILNQADVLDVDMATGVTRDSSWFGVYSPVGERYEISFSANAVNGLEKDNKLALHDVTADIMPLTLAGDGFGGAEQKSYITRIWDKSYALDKVDETAKIDNVPLTTRSSKSFFGRWTGVMEGLPATPELTDDGLVLRGSVINPFDVPIYSAFIVYKGGAYSLGTLAPGETRIERGMSRLEPNRVFNEHRSSVPTAKLKNWDSTSYNTVSTRLPYIFRAASFYEFAGGEDNFGIGMKLQRDVDLSELLRCGRAVIFGTIVDPEFESYEVEDKLSRRSSDALEMARLERRLAEQRGEKVENRMEAAIEQYGLNGTSESFEPTKVEWSEAGADPEIKAANKRTVVVRLIVPLS